jgi:hypothetical protein
MCERANNKAGILPVIKKLLSTHTSRNAATIDRKRGTEFQSTDAGWLDRRLPYLQAYSPDEKVRPEDGSGAFCATQMPERFESRFVQ